MAIIMAGYYRRQMKTNLKASSKLKANSVIQKVEYHIIKNSISVI